jgi:hypothetical protein
MLTFIHVGTHILNVNHIAYVNIMPDRAVMVFMSNIQPPTEGQRPSMLAGHQQGVFTFRGEDAQQLLTSLSGR